MTTATTETPQDALARIQARPPGKNDALVILAFADAGIPPELIDPRFNVLTFNAWKAKGRRVAKGAKSIAVTVWIPVKGKAASVDETSDKPKRGGMRPKNTRLFHISQTVPVDAPRGTKPEAWQNPALVREDTYATPDDNAAKYLRAHDYC